MVFCETDVLQNIKEEILMCGGNKADKEMVFLRHLQKQGLNKTDSYIWEIIDIVITTWEQLDASKRNIACQTVDSISDFPAWKLTRFVDHANKRTDWSDRWKAAGESVNWEGALASPGEYPEWGMIALKSSPIWSALGRGVGGFNDTYGLPYPPFAIDSGLSWDDVEDFICKELGLL